MADEVNDGPKIDRERDLKAFDDTKAGVKGLVDAGISKIPHFFVSPTDLLSSIASQSASTRLQIPVIDLNHVQQNGVPRKLIIEEIRAASETWGFFQVVNHGIPKEVLDQMLKGVRRFHEQPHDVKKEYYSRDTSRKARFISNFDLYQSKAANWRDSLIFLMAPLSPDPQQLPAACRYIYCSTLYAAKRCQ